MKKIGKRCAEESSSSKITSFFAKRTHLSIPGSEIHSADCETNTSFSSLRNIDPPPDSNTATSQPIPLELESLSPEVQQSAKKPFLQSNCCVPKEASLTEKSHVIPLATSSVTVNRNWKRNLREEWKIVRNDDASTQDRMVNLQFSAEDPWGMWCKVCTKWANCMGIKYSTNFVKDHKNFRPPQRKKESVNFHFSSIAHLKCCEKEKSMSIPASESLICKKLTCIDPLVKEKMERIMRIVFYFALKDRPARDFASECELQKLNGSQLGNTYQNEISFGILLKYVSTSLQKEIIGNINKSNYLTLCTDGSTTKKTVEYEAVVIRYVDYTNSIYSVKTAYIGICEIENADAPGLADAIKKLITEVGITNYMQKLVCMTVDGASVNVGAHNGLVHILESPVHIHCFNHILDLCLKDAIKNNGFAMKIETLLRLITTFYRSSPKLTREIFRCGEALNIKILSFKKICDTRWADSFESVVLCIERNFQAIIQHLTDITSLHATGKCKSNVKSTAQSLLKQLLEFNNLYFFYAFADYISIIARTSRILETNNVTLTKSVEEIKKLRFDLLEFGSFNELKSADDKHLSTFLVTLEDKEESVFFNGYELLKEKASRRNNTTIDICDEFKTLCRETSSIISTRFFSNDDGPANSFLVRTAQTLDTAFFPPPTEDLKQYGDETITEFCYKFNLGIERAIAEWKHFKQIMNLYFRPSISLIQLLAKLKTEKFKENKTLTNIVEILLTIAPSNAEVERVWSGAKNTLKDKSLSMKKTTLHNRLLVKQSKINLNEFDPTAAIKLWWEDSVRSRRPNVNDKV